jgi:hypothetical protein
MTDFRDALRAELVAAAARPVPRRPALTLPRLPLRRIAVVAVVAAAVVAAIVVAPWSGRHTPTPAEHQGLPGQPLFGGSLEPGVRYHTRALRPEISFRTSGNQWFVYAATSPTALVLQRRQGDSAKGTERPPQRFLMFLRLPTLVDPSSGDIAPAPDDLVSALRANPDLGITSETRTRLYGRPATQLNFHIPAKPERVDPACEFAKVTVDTEPPAVATCAAFAPGVALPVSSSGRLIVPDGADPLVVAQIALVPSEAGRIARESQPVLDSVLIGH